MTVIYLALSSPFDDIEKISKRRKKPRGRAGTAAGVAEHMDSRVGSLSARLAEVMDKWRTKITLAVIEQTNLGKRAGVLCALLKAKPKLPSVQLVSFADDIRDAIYEDLAESFGAGGKGALRSLGIGAEDMLDVVNEHARDYAARHAAELVDGIDKTTREILADLITHAVDDGWSAAELSDAIASGGAFSEARADMIARTELATAFTQGNIDSWSESGVVVGKQWVVAPDACDECESMEGEVVGLDEDFSAGVSGPPLHPNCRCDISPVLEGEKADLSSLLRKES